MASSRQGVQKFDLVLPRLVIEIVLGVEKWLRGAGWSCEHESSAAFALPAPRLELAATPVPHQIVPWTLDLQDPQVLQNSHPVVVESSPYPVVVQEAGESAAACRIEASVHYP